jgi:hypothetical protein
MKDLSVILEMIQSQLRGVNNVIENSKTNAELYEKSYLKGYKDATQEIADLVEKINAHIQKGGK